MRKANVVVAMLFVAQAVAGADSDGEFMLGGGVGSVKCPTFVSIMKRARTKRIGSLAYVNETNAFTMYLLGFQSGYNMAKDDTYDVFPDAQDHSLLAWAENWCRSNSTRVFGDAAVALAADRHAARIRSAPR
jgi:hypothetical protein